MITLRRSEERGHADHGWLDSYHTFSFATYYDHRHMGFGVLRVINQDRVQGGHGFPMHPHRDMEIITYILDGALEHADSMGNQAVMHRGDVQVISAGTGMVHSEYNASATDPVHFLQIWILPDRRGGKPVYHQRSFPEPEREGKLRLIASADGRDGSAPIRQRADLYAAVLDTGHMVAHDLEPGRRAWVHVATGEVEVNGHRLFAGDGASLVDEQNVTLRGRHRADLVLFDLP